MQFVGWMLDLAREQSPAAMDLSTMLRRSRDAGYNALGLYLEHRFAYPSAPWAAAPGCLTPQMARDLSAQARSLGMRLIPFLNTLGHMEGFIRSHGGQWLAEQPDRGDAPEVRGSAVPGHARQICPSRPECVEFVRALIADALAAFDDEWVHLGGDETRQLGQCPLCAERAARIGPGGLYAQFYAPLCEWVLGQGRRPCLWGDMLSLHREALPAIPPQTVIFDWQYFSRPEVTTAMFRTRGFDVVCCPSLQTYNSGWCFLAQSQQNIDDHAQDARACGALGVLLTTWEFAGFSQYASVLPLIYAAARRLTGGLEWSRAIALEGGEPYARAAEILGNHIPAACSFLRPGTWRQLREHLAWRQDPFWLWRAWRDEACGAAGDAVLHLCDQACRLVEPESPLNFPIELHRVAVLWVRAVESAAQAYARGEAALCAAQLRHGLETLERLRPGLSQAAAQGGSQVDPARLDRLQRAVGDVLDRLRGLPAQGWRPAFEVLVHPRCLPGDQAAWATAL